MSIKSGGVGIKIPKKRGSKARGFGHGMKKAKLHYLGKK